MFAPAFEQTVMTVVDLVKSGGQERLASPIQKLEPAVSIWYCLRSIGKARIDELWSSKLIDRHNG